MRTHIDLPFGDGIYTFKLPLPLIAELQRKTELGIGALYAKLLKGRYLLPQENGPPVPMGAPNQAQFALADVVEPIRLALIGGNHARVDGADVEVSPARVQELMDAYVYPARPLSEAWDFAVAILSVCVEGWDDPDKKKEDEPPAPRKTEATKDRDGSITPEPSAISPSQDAPSSKRGKSRSRNTKPS